MVTLVKDYWPCAYSGLPAVLQSISIVLFTVTLLMLVGNVGDIYVFMMFFTGIVLALMSIGNEVKITNGELLLTYGYPFKLIKVRVKEVVHIADINALERGKLFKYFKVVLVPFIMITAFPLLYVLIKGASVPLQYSMFLAIPIFVGAALIGYFMVSSRSYKAFLQNVLRVLVVLLITINFFLAIEYHRLYSGFITRDLNALIPLMLAEILLFIFFVAMLVNAVKRHVIIVEDSRGRYYAIASASEVKARELIELIVSKVMVSDS